MKNIKLILQYDGTNYHGFQFQNDVISIQQVLQDAILKVFNKEIKVNGCSRTDAKVHAVKYCAGFEFDVNIPTSKIPEVLNKVLPADVRILSAHEMDASFHPRFSTKSKTYRYVINTSKTPSVFSKNYEWQIQKKLDITSMKKACKYIVGKHDFTSFMSAGSNVEDCVRNVYFLKIKKKKDNIVIYINADGYLYNMVRIIVGTLYDVGNGKYSPEEVKKIIEKKDRSYSGPTAPPQGLSLFDVIY